MTIYEFADIIGRDLEITRYNNQNERWTCKFVGAEVKDDKSDSLLHTYYGNAKSPVGAVQDYTSKIRGKILIFNSFSREMRSEYNVPQITKSPL